MRRERKPRYTRFVRFKGDKRLHLADEHNKTLCGAKGKAALVRYDASAPAGSGQSDCVECLEELEVQRP